MTHSPIERLSSHKKHLDAQSQNLRLLWVPSEISTMIGTARLNLLFGVKKSILIIIAVNCTFSQSPPQIRFAATMSLFSKPTTNQFVVNIFFIKSDLLKEIDGKSVNEKTVIRDVGNYCRLYSVVLWSSNCYHLEGDTQHSLCSFDNFVKFNLLIRENQLFDF